MFKFFILILQITLVLILVLFLINNSFLISFEINDFIYSISSSYIFVVFLIFLLLIFLSLNLYFKLKFKYSKHKLNKFLVNKNKGYDSFVSGMIALANKDYKKAISETKKISYYLDDNKSLSLLLKSEIYKVEKKFDDLNLVYQEMMKNKNTENLAYKGMMEQYINAQDYHHAFLYGEKLFNNNPYIEKIYDALVNIISKTNNWQQLLFITDKAYTKKIIDKKVFQENKSIGYFEIAKIKRHSEIEDSLECIEKSLKLRNNFPPYVKLYLDLLIENKEYNHAKKYLKKTWNIKPHPEYKSIISDLAKNLNISQLELVKFITGNKTENEDSIILLVESYISQKKWDLARSQIMSLLDVNPKKKICLLMAKIEEGDTGDIQKTNSWILRSRNGKENNIWVCMISKKSQLEWSSISTGGYFNSLEWKQPFVISDMQNTNINIAYEN